MGKASRIRQQRKLKTENSRPDFLGGFLVTKITLDGTERNHVRSFFASELLDISKYLLNTKRNSRVRFEELNAILPVFWDFDKPLEDTEEWVEVYKAISESMKAIQSNYNVGETINSVEKLTQFLKQKFPGFSR